MTDDHLTDTERGLERAAEAAMRYGVKLSLLRADAVLSLLATVKALRREVERLQVAQGFDAGLSASAQIAIERLRDEVAALRREAVEREAVVGELVAVVQRLEWGIHGDCPMCPATANPLYRQHAEGCKLSAALARAAAGDGLDELHRAIRDARRDYPLPRCAHGWPLVDHGGTPLEPSCGCRAAAGKGET